MNYQRDKYGALWPPEYELCLECGQPDNCGDCDHTRLSNEDVEKLGGIPRYFEQTPLGRENV